MYDSTLEQKLENQAQRVTKGITKIFSNLTSHKIPETLSTFQFHIGNLFILSFILKCRKCEMTSMFGLFRTIFAQPGLR